MIGAIIGDIVGSEYEFNNTNDYDFKMFGVASRFTDDSVCSLAVADALLENETSLTPKQMVQKFHKICLLYPKAGYGYQFAQWLYYHLTNPYGSLGNGAAMRISAVGWVANSEKEAKDLSYVVTSVTHNHKEGLKGAELVALCIYKLRKGANKAEIAELFKEYYPDQYDVLDNSFENLQTLEHGMEFCQITVPKALYCFLKSNSFEDCLRLAVSMGGDSDTLACIACSIAEAYGLSDTAYVIPDELKEKCYKKLDKYLSKILKRFETKYNK